MYNFYDIHQEPQNDIVEDVTILRRFQHLIDQSSQFIDDITRDLGEDMIHDEQQQRLTAARIQQLQRLPAYRIINDVQQQGLTTARIRQFQHFPADESLAGDICSVCQYEIELGSSMMRLDCKGQHVFCKDCVEGWFADHKTCPNCRHVFA